MHKSLNNSNPDAVVNKGEGRGGQGLLSVCTQHSSVVQSGTQGWRLCEASACNTRASFALEGHPPQHCRCCCARVLLLLLLLVLLLLVVVVVVWWVEGFGLVG